MDSNLTDIGFTKETTYAAPAPGGVRATGTFTMTGGGANAETITINGKVYTLKAALTVADGDVLIGANQAATIANLVAAINLTAGGAGVQYGANTTIHATVSAIVTPSLVGVMTAIAKASGTAANAYGTTDTVAVGSWAAVTMSGGISPIYATKTKFRFKSESLKHAKETASDESIRSDRMVDELIQLGIGAGGSIESEFYLGDEIFTLQCSALMGTPVNVAFATGGSNLSATAQTVTGVTNAIAQGARVIRITGATNPANNGIKTVVAYQGGNTLLLAPGSIVTTEGASAITIYAKYVRTGVLVESYMIEKYGVTLNTYMQYLGMMIDSMGVTLEAKKKITQTFGFLGYGGLESLDSGMLASTAAGAGGVLTGSNNIGFVLVGGITPVSSIKKLDFGIKNNLRARGALGKLGTILPGTGSSDVAGQMDAYFDDLTNLRTFLAHASVAIQTSMIDKGGSGFGVHFPSVTYADANWNVGGLNQDIMQPVSFKAVRDQTLGYQMQLDYVL